MQRNKLNLMYANFFYKKAPFIAHYTPYCAYFYPFCYAKIFIYFTNPLKNYYIYFAWHFVFIIFAKITLKN